MSRLTDEQLHDLFESLEIPDSGRRIVEHIRTSPPVRATRGGPKNNCGYYSSGKMGLTIQFESSNYELAFIKGWEREVELLEYYDQCIQIKVTYLLKNGRNHAVFHTPDFLCIRISKIGFVEVKTEAKMAELAEEQPGRYVKGEDGRWHSPPCEAWANEHGLGYWIQTDSQIDRTYIRNLDFLAQYFGVDPATICEEAFNFIRGRLAATPAILLSDLIDVVLQAKISTDDIYTLIVADLIYVDLSAAALAEEDRVHVFINYAAAESYDPSVRLHNLSDANVVAMTIGQCISFGDKKAEIVNITENEVWISSEGQQRVVILTHAEFEDLLRRGKISGLNIQETSGYREEVSRILNETSPTDMKEALRRYDFVTRYKVGERFSADVIPPSSLFRYLSAYKEGQDTYGSGFLTLIPDFHSRGDRSPRFPPEVLDKVKKHIENNFETPKQKSFSSVHSELMKDCEADGFIAPSLPTFIKMVRKRPTHIQVRNRRGPKAAKSVAPYSRWLEKDTPRQGDRPLQICHIDHTKLDVTFTCSITGRILGRPWVTFMSCGWTRILPAVYMTFDPPSYRSCLMTIRECVRRLGRLPEYLVVDGGKEFSSIYFRALCAFYGIHIISREGKPRNGSTCERLFGTNRTQFANNMIGNTQIMRNVREVSKEVNPETLAAWTLRAGYPRLTEWAYSLYETNDHFSLKRSPREAFTAGMERFGPREHTKIIYDEVFRDLTLPTTRKGTAKLQLNDGVKINNIYYWSDEFRNPELVGKQVPVRYDPFNMGEAQAYVNGRWIKGISELHWFFKDRTEREMQLASSEIRRRDTLLNRNRTITGTRLADFVASLEQEEESLRAQRILLQRSRDLEGTGVRALINGGQAPTPSPKQLPEYSQGHQSAAETPSATQNSEEVETYPKESEENISELGLIGELDW
jgi:putative transposase